MTQFTFPEVLVTAENLDADSNVPDGWAAGEDTMPREARKLFIAAVLLGEGDDNRKSKCGASSRREP